MSMGFLDAEYGVIGALLIEPSVLPTIADALTPDDFSIDANRVIYAAALELRQDGKNIDAMTIAQKINSPEVKQYMMECMDMTPTAAHVAEYVEIVKNASMKRAIKAEAAKVQEMAEGGEDYTAPLGYAIDTFTALAESGRGNDIVNSMTALKDFYEYRQKFDDNPEGMFVRTGIDDVDKALGGGLVNTGFYVLAARPGIGKTTLALQIADNLAMRGRPVLFVSLEMPVEQLTAKRLARETGVNYSGLMMRALTEEDYTKIAKASNILAKFPFMANRKMCATVAQIEVMARQVKDLRLIVVDYLGLVRPAEKRGSRYEEMTETSAALKSLAVRLKVPILCLAQLNRESMNEKGKRPRLHHFLDSGAIEQDADGVMLLHNPDADAEPSDSATRENKGQQRICYIDKNRHGATGQVKFVFYGKIGKFYPMYERG